MDEIGIEEKITPGTFELLPGVSIAGFTLYLHEEKTLVCSDLHLGFEEDLRAQGVMVPKIQYGRILEHLERVFDLVEVSRVVVNGDLKHEFGRISRQEWGEVNSFIMDLRERGKEAVLVRGNHDTMLEPVARKAGADLKDYLYFPSAGIYVCHGHVVPDDACFRRSKIVVIGHDHPTVLLSDGVRNEKVKCFLKGDWQDKTLIQLPSLNYITEGSDLLMEETLSPFTVDAAKFSVYAVEDFHVFPLGMLGDLKKQKM